MYSEYGTAFDGKSEWNLGSGFARNVLIFGVDNSSSSHTDIRKNKFLILNEGPTYDINKRFSLLEKNFSINFSKARSKFCFSLHYNGDNKYLFLNGKEIFTLKANNGNVKSSTWFFLDSIFDRFHAAKSREVSLGGNINDFSVVSTAIDKPDILNICKYLML